MEKQQLRNALADIEDRARVIRKNPQHADMANLIVQFAKIVREEIVK